MQHINILSITEYVQSTRININVCEIPIVPNPSSALFPLSISMHAWDNVMSSESFWNSKKSMSPISMSNVAILTFDTPRVMTSHRVQFCNILIIDNILLYFAGSSGFCSGETGFGIHFVHNMWLIKLDIIDHNLTFARQSIKFCTFYASIIIFELNPFFSQKCRT